MLGHNMKTIQSVFWLTLFAALAGFARGEVSVEGSGFEIAELEEGAVAFSNRDYVFRDVPARVRGWQFTRLPGGRNAAEIKAKRATAGSIFMVTAPEQEGTDLEGWAPARVETFHYTDPNNRALRVYYRSVEAGEEVSLPQGNWTGGIVIARELSGEAVAPERDDSKVPGVVITHSPKETGRFVGSPGLEVLPDGAYLAKSDEFGPGSTFNTTHLFRSTDRGLSWEHVTTIENLFWATLFRHGDALYLFGTARQFGDTVILRSVDGGESWTTPKDESSGLLHRGEYHTAPMPVVIHEGRIWRAMEDAEGHPREWGRRFRAFMMSASVDSDLLKAENWRSTNRLSYQDGYVEGFGGWLEGNAVVNPDGEMVNVLRADFRTPGEERAAIQKVAAAGEVIEFDRNTGFVDFPGGTKKFTIRHDPETNRYWTLSNHVPPRHFDQNPERTRNTVALMASEDLLDWEVRAIVLYHPDVRNHGFQYLDWQFEGDDIIAVSRTAYDDGLGGADNQHNANYLTFHRLQHFREMSNVEVPDAPHPGPGPVWEE
jgi:hypothetical protein